MEYRGRMAAYAMDEIPNLSEKAVPVITQRKENIVGMTNNIFIYIYIYIIIIGSKIKKWICITMFSYIRCVLLAILFTVFLSLYIKLNGDYKDIQEENDSISIQNTELEIANGLLIQENDNLNNTLQSLLKAINDDYQNNNSIPNNTDVNNTSVDIIELINKLMNENNVTKTELKILQRKYAELNTNCTQLQRKFDLLFEEYQTDRR